VKRNYELSGHRGWPALRFQAWLGQRQAGPHAGGGCRNIPDQHRRLHLPETRQHPRNPQRYPRAPREAVSSSSSHSISLISAN